MSGLEYQRNQSLDFLKALSIFLVVFFHNSQLNPSGFWDNFFMLAANAAVPCFFLASGAVFFLRPFHMGRHIRKILLFYVTVTVWRSIYLILYLYWGAPFTGSLRAICSYLFLFQTWDGVGTAHFWFMDAMLTVLIAAPLLHLCFHAESQHDSQGKHREILLFLLAILLLFNQLPSFGNLVMNLLSRLMDKPAWDISPLAEVSPFSFRYSNYFTYYLLGGLLMELKDRIPPKSSFLLMGGGITGLFLAKYIQTGSLLWNDTHLLGGYYLLSTMALAAGMFLFTQRTDFSKHKLQTWLARRVGTNTLGIFYLHIPLIHLLTPQLFQKLTPWNNWITNTLESALICALALIISLISQKLPLIKKLF